MVSRKAFYGAIYLTASGCGIAKGVCEGKEINLPVGVSPLLMFGMLFAGIVGGFLKEADLGYRGYVSPPAGGTSLACFWSCRRRSRRFRSIDFRSSYGAGYLAGKVF